MTHRNFFKSVAYHHHHERIFVFFIVGETGVLLDPEHYTNPRGAILVSQLHIDNIVTLSIVAVDSKGNVIPGTTFDSPPVWAPSSNPSAATGAVSTDGLSEVVTPVAGAVGQVATFGVTVVIGGTTFTASVDETIISGAVAGIKIVETFSPAP